MASMTDQTLHRSPQCAVHQQTRWGAVLLGFAIFGLLWTVYIPYRRVYVPNELDIPALADGLLLASGAHWQDWFTVGYSHFWDLYPEWPEGMTGFARPAFQFVIYLAHFALGRDWASYQIISCFAAAGMAAVAFLIARTALELATGPSLLAASLVALSPPVLQAWMIGVSAAHDPLATILVAGAFLAVVGRCDFLCLMLLFLGLLTKESAVWAPAAAAITIMLRPKPDEPLHRRAFVAATMFLPVVMWLVQRYAFFGGIGGTYVTAAPLAELLPLTFRKLTHIDALFVTQGGFVAEGSWAVLDRVTRLGTRLLMYALFFLLALRFLLEVMDWLRYAVYERRWPTVDAAFLVLLWAATAIAFHFALPVQSDVQTERYATSLVVFAWPALVAEVERHRKGIIWLGLVVCCVVSLARSSYVLLNWIATGPQSARSQFGPMTAALHQVPMATRQVYIVNAGGLQDANPEYVRVVLGVPAEIVRVIDIKWQCGAAAAELPQEYETKVPETRDGVAFDHSLADGVVAMTVTLPPCAVFVFTGGRGPLDVATMLANGLLYRNAKMSYELPDAYPSIRWGEPAFYLGRKMTVHIRPNGPARFIIQQVGPQGIVWFDTP
jgi:hypothetical protein